MSTYQRVIRVFFIKTKTKKRLDTGVVMCYYLQKFTGTAVTQSLHVSR